jgi:hypothetical protein
MYFKNNNPYYLSDVFMYEKLYDTDPLSQMYGLEVNQETGIGTITNTYIYQMPNKFRGIEGHSETEFITHVFFNDDETIIDYPKEIPELISLCKKYINNPVKFERL